MLFLAVRLPIFYSLSTVDAGHALLERICALRACRR